MLNKIGLIGGGNIGGVLAQELTRRPLAKTIAMAPPRAAVLPVKVELDTEYVDPR